MICRGILRIQAQGLVIVSDSVCILSQVGFGYPPAIVRRGIRVQLQRLVIVGDGICILPQTELGFSPVAVRRGMIRVQTQSLVVVGHGFPVLVLCCLGGSARDQGRGFVAVRTGIGRAWSSQPGTQQHGPELRDALWALGYAQGQGLLDSHTQRLGQPRGQGHGLARIFLQPFQGPLGRRPGQSVVKCGAQAENICTGPETPFAAVLFRCGVVLRQNPRVLYGPAGLEGPHRTEIDQYRAPVPGQQDVGRLEVAVQQLMAVYLPQSLAQVHGQLLHSLPREHALFLDVSL